MEQTLETHQEALQRLQLMVGDQVKLVSKSNPNEIGWVNFWEERDLNRYAGATGPVVFLTEDTVNVRFANNDDECYAVPAFALEVTQRVARECAEPVKEPAINLNAPPVKEFNPGDRVRILKAPGLAHLFPFYGPKMIEAVGSFGIIGGSCSISGINCWSVVLDDSGEIHTYPWYALDLVEASHLRIGGSSQPTNPASQTVLDEAKSLIYGDREQDYGRVTDNFNDIAKGWEVITKAKITPEQVGLMMAWLKICRANKDNCDKRDSLVDLAGYAGCIEKIKSGL